MKLSQQQGYSLVELLVVLAISGAIAIAIIGFFISQNRTHVSQEQVTLMQQNMRAGLGFMARELRMAGYNLSIIDPVAPAVDPPPAFSDAGIGRSTITFNLNLNDDNVLDADETIAYSLDTAKKELKRNGTVLADGIDDLAFAYAFDSDGDGLLETDAGGDVLYALVGPGGTGVFGGANWHDLSNTDTGTLARAEDVRAVRIWLLARTDEGDPGYVNSQSYVVGNQTKTVNDTLRRRLLDTVVRCRNLGL